MASVATALRGHDGVAAAHRQRLADLVAVKFQMLRLDYTSFSKELRERLRYIYENEVREGRKKCGGDDSWSVSTFYFVNFLYSLPPLILSGKISCECCRSARRTRTRTRRIRPTATKPRMMGYVGRVQ